MLESCLVNLSKILVVHEVVLVIDLHSESEFSTISPPSDLETIIPSDTGTLISSGKKSDNEIVVTKD